MERGDFEKWVRWTIGDDKLADKLADVSRSKVTSQNIRERTLNLVEQRVEELEKAAEASKNVSKALTPQTKT